MKPSHGFWNVGFFYKQSCAALHSGADRGLSKCLYAALRKNGIFVFNIEHPVFTSGIRQEFVQDANGKNLYWPIDDYFISGPRDTVFLGEHVEKQHHTLTEVLQGLLDTGFAIEAVQEVRPTDEVIESNGWQDELRRPMMLLVKARKV